MRHARGVRAQIGTLIMEITVVDGEYAPVTVHCRAYVMNLLARMIGGDEMLAPILDPFHRPAKTHGCDADENVFRIKLAPDAEAPAHMGFVHMD